MIQLSTFELNLLFLENTIDEPSCALSKDDNDFYNTLKEELDKEIRHPHPSSIESILAYSRSL